MYVKNVLMDENEGLYIDLTDLNTRLDNIHKPYHDGTDEVPEPKEETQNVSVLWGPVALGETAKFYAWQACYYTYETETVSYDVYQNVYNDTLLTGSTDSVQTDYFWRGVTEIVVNTQEAKHGDWCYAYEGPNDTVLWTSNHPMASNKTFDNTKYKSYPGGLADPKTGIVDSTLTISNMTADTTRWKAVKMSTENTTNIKIHRILVKDAIIYTTDLPSGIEEVKTYTVNFYKDLAHPYDITSTSTFVDTSDFASVGYVSSGFNIINAVNMQNFYLKHVADTYSNSIADYFFVPHYIKVSTVNGQPAALCSTASHRAYLSPNKDGSGTSVSEDAVDYIALSLEDVLNTQRNARTVDTSSLNITALDALGKTQSFHPFWDTDGEVTQSTDEQHQDWYNEIKSYFSKEGRTESSGIYKYDIKQQGIYKKNLTATIFTNTTFYSHIPVYVCDTTGMKMLCTFTESSSQSVNGVTKNVAHFMPATNANKVYLESTFSNPGLRSKMPTSAFSNKPVGSYGGFRRMPYYDKTVPLKGVYITSEDESLSPQAIGPSTTDPYHLYYATSDTASDYKNVINAKSITSYGSPM